MKEKLIKQEIEEVIEIFQNQIKQLKEMIVIICKTVVKDDEIKENMLRKMEQIKNIETHEEEIEVITQNNQHTKQKYVQAYKKDINEQNEKIKISKKKQLKIKGHLNVSIDITGDTQAKIEWYNRIQQEKLKQSKRAQIMNIRNEQCER